MNEAPLFSWRNRIFRRTTIALAVTTLATILVT